METHFENFYPPGFMWEMGNMYLWNILHTCRHRQIMGQNVTASRVLGLRLLHSLQSSDSFGWHLGGHFCQEPETGVAF